MIRRLPSLPGRLPSWVAVELGIPHGEKVLAWGCGPGRDVTEATYAVATNRALYVQDGHQRLPWSRISKATWDEPALDVVVLDETGRPGALVRLRLDDAKDLPAAVFDRVTDSVLVNERVDLGDGAGALLVARRGSDDGEVAWSVVFDSGLDPGHHELRRRADEALARLRESLGI